MCYNLTYAIVYLKINEPFPLYCTCYEFYSVQVDCYCCHIFLFRTEEPAKVGTCARGSHVLQQLALNVHIKQFDLDLECDLDPDFALDLAFDLLLSTSSVTMSDPF